MTQSVDNKKAKERKVKKKKDGGSIMFNIDNSELSLDDIILFFICVHSLYLLSHL